MIHSNILKGVKTHSLIYNSYDFLKKTINEPKVLQIKLNCAKYKGS